MKSSANTPDKDKEQYLRKVERFRLQKQDRIKEITEDYRINGTVQFTRRITLIPKKTDGPPERPISLFPPNERIILRSMLLVSWQFIEPIIVPAVCFCTYKKDGLHPPRGTQDAVHLIAAERRAQRPFIFETDIKGFFDNIPRQQLFEQVQQLITDPGLAELISNVLHAKTELDSRYVDFLVVNTSLGVPQGSALSPLLACTFLSPFDQFMKDEGYKMFRYVDDLVVLCQTEEESEKTEVLVRQKLQAEYSLNLSDTKTRHVDPDSSLEFLGYTIFADGHIEPGMKSRKKVREKIFTIVSTLPKIPDKIVARELTHHLVNHFKSEAHCELGDQYYIDHAVMIKDALIQRRLEPRRLTNLLKKSSNKWEPAFLEALP